MKVKINSVITDTEKEPIILVFENDAERLRVIKLLTDMEPKEGVRKFCIFPGTDNIENLQKWFDEEIKF